MSKYDEMIEGKVDMNINVVNNMQDTVSVTLTNEGTNKINIAINPKGKSLQELSIGEIFTNPLGDFIVLEHYDNGTTGIIRKEPLKKMRFGPNNDWRTSDVRKYLNDEYTAELHKYFGRDNLTSHSVNLLSLDGLDDYGVSTDTVSLLTIDQYRKYRNVLGANLTSWWWLATPDSTPSGNGADYVLYVNSSGDVLYDGSCWCGGGVRPFLTLKSSTLIS